MSTLPSRSRITEGDAQPARPGWAQGLGVAHIVIAVLSSVYLAFSLIWVLILVGSRATGGGSSVMMGMDDPRFMAFTLVDAVTALVVNGFVFASGVALLNLRGWGARVWRWLAPVMIARQVIVWGGFIIAVAPPFARNMGQAVAQMMRQQAPRRTLLQNAANLSLVYAWMFLAVGVGMIVVGSIYPAASWWLTRRRGIQVALGLDLATEPEQDPVAPGSFEEARLS